jgi:16S rRNA (guanine527-N7)-methyltransferase
VSPDALIGAAGSLGVTLDEHQADQLERFVARLSHWNRRFNLVSRRDMGRIWPRHVLDSLSVIPLLERYVGLGPTVDGRTPEVLDAGTGAGFPGLPLAIAAPMLLFHLVDRNSRRIRFIEMIAAELELANVRTCCAGLDDDAALPARVDAVVSRAVQRPLELARQLGSRLVPGGVMLLLSGARGDDSEDGSSLEGHLPPGLALEPAYRIMIPGLDRPHEVTIIRQTG